MFLSSINLKDFRSYGEKSLNLTKAITVIVGRNAIGKTNILESIILLSLGRSFRTGKDEEMIRFGQDFGRVSGVVDGQSLEVVLTRGLWQGKKVSKKRYLSNGVAKMRKDFIGHLKTVLFEPRDLDLIIGTPAVRRDYLDFIISQVDLEYDRSLLSYQKGIRQRNRVLTFIREGRGKLMQLEFWNRLLIKNGDIIRSRRDNFINFANNILNTDHKSNLPKYHLIYTPSPISEKRLEEHQAAEIATGNTLVGPHRDDFEVYQDSNGEKERDLATFGSRGEQRLAVLALKLVQLQFIKQETQEKPILLLDDVFSELDQYHDQLVMQLISGQQAIITTTGFDNIKDNIELIKL